MWVIANTRGRVNTRRFSCLALLSLLIRRTVRGCAVQRQHLGAKLLAYAWELATMGGLQRPDGIIRFADFELDLAAGELRKQGAKIRLQEQPFQLLHILLQCPGRMVTREELQQKIWPSDTFVDFDHGLYNAIKRLREALADDAEKPRYIETVPRRGYRFVGKIEIGNPVPDKRIQSLAVLPLENLSRHPEQEYFAEGLTEALITTLAKIGELRVVSRTSVMQYKGVRMSIKDIARELEVDVIVEGTVLRADKRIRISAQLITGSDDRHLWAESYERDMRDILSLQAELAQAIAREIRVKLSPVDQARLAIVHAADAEAYQAYLKGRYHWNRRPAEFKEAIQCFKEAIAKDSTYVAAYAGLADCLSGLNVWGIVPASEGSAKAKALAQKAIEMDHSSSEAHVSLAFAAMYHYDFLTAEREFERAIELNPRYTLAHQLFGWYLCITDRYEEAYAEFQRAIRLDPLSSIIHAMLGYVFIYARRYDQALKQCAKALDLDPTSGPAHLGLGWAYRCKSSYEPAIASLRRACELWPGSTPIGVLGEVHAAAGYRAEAQKILEQLKELWKKQYVTPYVVARIHVTLGEIDEAFHWLEVAYQQRAEWMVVLKVDPCLDNLRSEPRFQNLMRRMNFPAKVD